MVTGDDLVDLDRASLLELHRRLDGVRVERVEVLLPDAVQSPRRRVDALLDGGVRHLLHQDADLHLGSRSSNRPGGWMPSEGPMTRASYCDPLPIDASVNCSGRNRR
jgi:hypothetical protein